MLAYKDTMWLHYSVVSDFTVSKHFCPFNVPPTNVCLCIIIVCVCVCVLFLCEHVYQFTTTSFYHLALALFEVAVES